MAKTQVQAWVIGKKVGANATRALDMKVTMLLEKSAVDLVDFLKGVKADAESTGSDGLGLYLSRTEGSTVTPGEAKTMKLAYVKKGNDKADPQNKVEVTIAEGDVEALENFMKGLVNCPVANSLSLLVNDVLQSKWPSEVDPVVDAMTLPVSPSDSQAREVPAGADAKKPRARKPAAVGTSGKPAKVAKGPGGPRSKKALREAAAARVQALEAEEAAKVSGVVEAGLRVMEVVDASSKSATSEGAPVNLKALAAAAGGATI